MNDMDYFPTVDIVWWDPNGGVVFLGGEMAITPEFLQQYGIQHVITVNEQSGFYHGTLAEVREQHPNVRWSYFPFLDDYSRNQTETHARNAGAAVEALVGSLRAGERVVVHCAAGMHRSPAVVYNALLALGYFDSAYDAYGLVKKHRPVAGYVKSLVKWVRKQHKARAQI